MFVRKLSEKRSVVLKTEKYEYTQILTNVITKTVFVITLTVSAETYI